MPLGQMAPAMDRPSQVRPSQDRSASDRPSHIPLPPPPVFDAPAAMASPVLPFFTPPTDPFPSPSVYFTPPTSPYTETAPAPPSPPPAVPIAVPVLDTPATDDAFPTVVDVAIDLVLDDEGLSTLEKIYLFSRSRASFHRVFIAHALPDYLGQVTPQEATEYVLPLLSGLAMDEDEQVKEALAAELVPVIWWFFSHCQMIPDDLRAEEAYASSSTTVTISVQAFTPILGTLLLSSNPLVGGAARFAVVNLLSRMKKADDKEASTSPSPSSRLSPSTDNDDDEEEEAELVIGLFKHNERAMFRHEILQQVVIGMGRLDVDVEMESEHFQGGYPDEYDYRQWGEQQDSASDVEVVTPGEQGNGEDGVSSPSELQRQRTESTSDKSDKNINPYFPVLPNSYSTSSPASSVASTPSTSSTPSTHSSSSSSPATSLTNNLSPIRELPPSSSGRLSSWTSSSSGATDSDHTPTPQRPSLVSPPLSPTSAVPPPSRNATDSQSAAVLHPAAELWQLPIAIPEEPQQQQPTYPPHAADYAYPYGSDDGEDEQAAVGRLSSMSLMAAVTASGSLGEETKRAFVKEVERVGRDHVYWVRREASFALGALAKVVPEEIVISSLLPLFDTLRWDAVWHVRHSVLFALPAILSRLPSEQRRSLALETILGLSSDESANVRSGVLEALGEVLYTFHKDPGGPPEELVQLFLGRKEDRRVRDGQQEEGHQQQHNHNKESPLESFYHDPERPLVIAFNFPAVALTLGGARWTELREVYLDIAANRAVKVRKTLAASLGELAKIIGPENARKDLVKVWWDNIRCEDEEVRTKAVECVNVFAGVLDKEAGASLLRGLLTVWDERVFRGWRERDLIVKGLAGLARRVGEDVPELVRSLLLKALEDNVAAVRESAVSTVPQIWSIFQSRIDVLNALQADLSTLARSPVYRKRMTFVACHQALIQSVDQISQSGLLDDNLLGSVADLAGDAIEGVRIGVARFTGVLCGKLHRESRPFPKPLLDLVQRISQDISQEVRSYIHDLSIAGTGGVQGQSPMTNTTRMRKHDVQLATFSRPPPPRASSSSSDTDETWRRATDVPDMHMETSSHLASIERTFAGSMSDDQCLAGFGRPLSQPGREQAGLHDEAMAMQSISGSPGGELGALESMSLAGDDDVEMIAPEFVHGTDNEVAVPG